MALLKSCFTELTKNLQLQEDLATKVAKINILSNDRNNNQAENDKSSNFLENFISEVLRKSPPIPFIARICTKDCFIRTKDRELLKFVKDDVIHIPVKLIQNDERNFRFPETFDPKRFDESSQKDKLLAFGYGPSHCPRSKLVMLQTKILLKSFLERYSIKTCDSNTKDRLNFLILEKRLH